MGQALTKEDILRELEKTEELIQKSSALRNKAEGTKEGYEEQLKQTEADLKALGTTPKKAEEDLEKIQSSIESELRAIKEEIPMDLLRDLKQI